MKGQCSCVCLGPVNGEPGAVSVPKGKTLLYTQPIAIEVTQSVIKALVRAEGMENSAVHTCAALAITSPLPTFEPNGGSSTALDFKVRLESPNAQAIYYTLDNSDPDETSLKFNDEIVISTTNVTIRARAKMENKDLSMMACSNVYELLEVSPLFRGDDTQFESEGRVYISCATPGCSIYWTSDGSAPTVFSAGHITDGVVGGAVTVEKTNTVIRGIATSATRSISAISESKIIHVIAVKPVIEPNGGLFVDSVQFLLSTPTPGSEIYYTLDGSDPNEGSRRFGHALSLSATGIVVKAIAIHPDMRHSDLAVSNDFKVTAAAPTLDPLAGTYIGQVEVNIVSTTAGSAIRCTTDGSIPTESSAVCLMPVVVTQTGTMIKAVATKDGMSVSAVASLAAAFVIKGVSPVVSPNGGSFTESATVVLSCSNPTAKIYWTLDGSMPTAEATLYTEPIVIEDNDSIVKAISIAEGKSPSEPMTSRLFTIEAGRVEFTAEGNKWGEETATSEGFVEEVKVRSCHSFVLAAALLASA